MQCIGLHGYSASAPRPTSLPQGHRHAQVLPDGRRPAGCSPQIPAERQVLCAASAAQSQAAGTYKYVLNQYRAVKAQLAPWMDQFQAQHGRSPRQSDAEASGIEGLCRQLQQYHLLKERVMHETQLLRQRIDESRTGGNANGSREAGPRVSTASSNRQAAAVKLGAALDYQNQQKRAPKAAFASRATPSAPAEEPEEELASDLPPRIRAAMQAAARYRKARSQPAAAVSASSTPAAARLALVEDALPQLTTISSAAGRWFLTESPPPPPAGTPGQQTGADLSFFAADAPTLGFSAPRVDLRDQEASLSASPTAALSEPAALNFEDTTAPAAAAASSGTPELGSSSEQVRTEGAQAAGQPLHKRVLPLPDLAAADLPAREDAEAMVALRPETPSLQPSASHSSSPAAMRPEAAQMPFTRRRTLPLPLPGDQPAQPAQPEAASAAAAAGVEVEIDAPEVPEPLFQPAFDLRSELEQAQAALSLLTAEPAAPSTSASQPQESRQAAAPASPASLEVADEVAAAVAAAAAEVQQLQSRRQAQRQRVTGPSPVTRAELRLLASLLQRQSPAPEFPVVPAAA